jgi:hypothetical protein
MSEQIFVYLGVVPGLTCLLYFLRNNVGHVRDYLDLSCLDQFVLAACGETRSDIFRSAPKNQALRFAHGGM